MSTPSPIPKPVDIFGRSAVETIKIIDETLVQIADSLRRGQPAYKGKLGIVWNEDNSRYKRPVVVSYVYNKAGLPRSRKVKQSHLVKKAKTKSSFLINHAEVRQLLKLTQELLKIRAEINRRMGYFEVWEKSLSKVRDKVSEFQGEIKTIRGNIENNLSWRMTSEERLAQFPEMPDDEIMVSDLEETITEDQAATPLPDPDEAEAKAYLRSKIPEGAVILGDPVTTPQVVDPIEMGPDDNKTDEATESDDAEARAYLRSKIPKGSILLEELVVPSPPAASDKD
jgi:hypothetical protein